MVDFKSDRVSPGGERARAEEYRPQLAAYCQALSAILGQPVNRQVLWFFATDTAVELARDERMIQSGGVEWHETV